MTTELIAQTRKLEAEYARQGFFSSYWEVKAIEAIRALRAALEAQQAGGEPVTLVRGVPVHGLLPEDRAPMEAIVDAAYAHAAKLRNRTAPVEQVDAPSDADYAFDDLNLRLIEVTEERDHLRAALAAQPAAERSAADARKEVVAWQIRTKFSHQNDNQWTLWFNLNAGEVGRMAAVTKMQPENYEMRALGVIPGVTP